ncbi:hypothetical protein [Malaciobacter marinus]|uniref:hypothetical protein n=1 Tax=Malaciobacter marinus TaxID=505249 RepID=UPI003AFFE925
MENLQKRPNTIDEVIIKKIQVVSGIVHIPEGLQGLVFGTVLTSKDGGLNWFALEKPIYEGGAYGSDEEVFHNAKTYKSLVDANEIEPGTDETKWQELEVFNANGVLIENIKETNPAAILITGEVRAKYLSTFDDSMRQSLFTNKIILR